MGEVIFIIIIVLFLVGKVLAKAFGSTKEGQTPGEGGEEAYETPQDKIRQFLEQVQGGRQQPARRSSPPAVPVTPAQTPQERFPIAEPVEAIPVAQPARPAKKAVKRKTKEAPRTRVAPLPATAPPPPQSNAPTTVRLPGANLKKAVVWSEILRPPVSMRKRVGHRPPQLEKK